MQAEVHERPNLFLDSAEEFGGEAIEIQHENEVLPKALVLVGKHVEFQDGQLIKDQRRCNTLANEVCVERELVVYNFRK